MSDTSKPGDDLFFEVSMHQCREQYAAFMYMQTRAQQIFSVSAVIAGILATVLISPQVGLTTFPKWLLAIIFLAFLCLSTMCMLVLSAKQWHSGPQLDLLAEKLPGVQEGNHSVPLWLGRQMNRSYKKNKSVQSRNACFLNIAIVSLIAMVAAMLFAAYTIVPTPS